MALRVQPGLNIDQSCDLDSSWNYWEQGDNCQLPHAILLSPSTEYPFKENADVNNSCISE